MILWSISQSCILIVSLLLASEKVVLFLIDMGNIVIVSVLGNKICYCIHNFVC